MCGRTLGRGPTTIGAPRWLRDPARFLGSAGGVAFGGSGRPFPTASRTASSPRHRNMFEVRADWQLRGRTIGTCATSISRTRFYDEMEQRGLLAQLRTLEPEDSYSGGR